MKLFITYCKNRVFFKLLFLSFSISILSIAKYLQPSEHGVGTHHQLGLAPCSFLLFTGYPCPSCGMTTTFALLADGRFSEGISNQPFGALLFLILLFVSIVMITDILLRKTYFELLKTWWKEHPKLFFSILIIGMFVGWMVKIIHY